MAQGWFQSFATHFWLYFLLANLLGIAFIVFSQAFLAYRFRKLYTECDLTKTEAPLPHAGIALCIRGSDSTLKACIEGLLHQDYPSFEIRVIVDSDADPAFALVKSLLDGRTGYPITVEKLNARNDRCGLKNAALLQAIDGFSARCKIFAWLDSDIAPQKNWLKLLVSHVREDSQPVACGIRWFCPPVSSLGAAVRHVWNTGALTQQLAFGIGWGGSIACARGFFERAHLRDLLATSMFEDTLISQVVADHGCKLKFVPQATMCNNESASVFWCRGFFTRQLLGVRLYHKKWRLVLWSGLFSAWILLGLAVAAITTDIYGNGLSGSLFLFFLLISILCLMALLMRTVENQVLSHLRMGEPGADEQRFMTKTPWTVFFLAIPITYFLCLFSLIEAAVIHAVTWRGISYQVNGPFDIVRQNHSAFEQKTSETASI